MRDALAASASPEAAASGPGQVLPRMLGAYELIEEIGRGGMGVVYRARQKALDRMVAVKLLLGGSFSSEAALRRFQTEAAAVADLHHPGIVAVHDFGECDGQPYLVMELVEGRNLGAACGGRPMDAGRAANLLLGLAHAIAHAHAHRILHRDLKPSNILVDQSGLARVTDFGLARRMGEETGVTLTGQMLGSPSYASPEQAAGRSEETGPAMDVYGLGALFYHLLTGRPPFNAATPAETLRLVLDAEPPAPTVLNPAVPRDLETICLKCLAKDPARRYPTAAAVADEVQRFLDHRPILARRPSMVHRIRKFARRHWIGVAATAGVILAVGLGAALSVAGYVRAERERLTTREARLQAEQLAELINGDMVAAMVWHSDQSEGIELVEKVLRYYGSLPPEARSPLIDRRYADALDLRAHMLSIKDDDEKGAAAAAHAAVAVREKIASENPDDDVAAADLICAQHWERRKMRQKEGKGFLEDDAEFVMRLTDLVERFSGRGHPKRALAMMLGLYADSLLPVSADEALAKVAQARALRGELKALGYIDGVSEHIDILCLRVESLALSHMGRAQEAADSFQKLLDLHAAALKRLPGDRDRRFRAGIIAALLSYEAAKAGASKRALEAEMVAREHFRVLLDRQPGDPDHLKCYALAHIQEASYLTKMDGHLERARAAWLHRDALFEPVKDRLRDTPGGIPFSRVYDMHELARIAARAGDEVAARAHMLEARRRFDAWQVAENPNPVARRIDRVREMESTCVDLGALRRWSELLAHADSMVAELDAGLAQQPKERELATHRVMADIYRGVALAGVGRFSEAIEILRAGLDRLSSLPRVGFVADHSELEVSGTLALCHALADTGQRAEAYQRAWGLLNKQGLVAGSLWVPNELRARLWVLVARVLDPDEVPLRLACCERAVALLTAPESEGRITCDGRDALQEARLIAIEARAAVDTMPLEELAAHLDAAAPTDSGLVEALIAADERAWGPDSAPSACFSRGAHDAQRAIRLRCEELLARRPESAGARFLHARTFRMEAYVPLALGGEIGPARAALAEYDARLEPFAALPGYECVGRIRALNRARLAQLSASVGEATLARREIREAGERAAAWLASCACRPPEQRRWRAQFLQEEAWCAWWLRDWVDLERLARESLAALGAVPAGGAEPFGLRARRAIGRAFFALGQHGAGDYGAARTSLEASRRELQEVGVVDAITDLQPLAWVLENAAVDGLRQLGEMPQARAEAERMLRSVEGQRPVEAERSRADLRRAEAQVRLAGLLDPRVPMEELRRTELLEEAYALLWAKDNPDRMTRDVAEMLAEVLHLRASCDPEDGVFGLGDDIAQAPCCPLPP